LDKGLRGEVVDLGRPVLAQDTDHRYFVEQVASHQRQLILNMGDTLEVNGAAAAQHPDDLVSLLKEQLGQIGAVLAGDTRDQRTLFHETLSLSL
jgi:RNase P/RNase MRP subunit p29